MPAPARTVAVLAWRAFVATTAKAVAWDHRELLALAGVSRGELELDVRLRAARLAHAVRFPIISREPTEVPGTVA